MRPEETTNGNCRIFKVKYLGPTNYRGSRVKITEQRNGFTDNVTLSFDYAIGDILEQSVKYIKKLGINVLGYGWTGSEYILFSDTWQYNNNDFITLKQ